MKHKRVYNKKHTKVHLLVGHDTLCGWHTNGNADETDDPVTCPACLSAFRDKDFDNLDNLSIANNDMPDGAFWAMASELGYLQEIKTIMRSLNWGDGLQVYGLYRDTAGRLYLVTGKDYSSSEDNVQGIIFDATTNEMECLFTIRTPVIWDRVGYVYKPNHAYSLKLEKIMNNLQDFVNQELEAEGITLQDCLEFLDDLRESGEINMFGATIYLISRMNLTRKTAKEILEYWMATFDERHRKDKNE